jgi:hypothetical protein
VDIEEHITCLEHRDDVTALARLRQQKSERVEQNQVVRCTLLLLSDPFWLVSIGYKIIMENIC